MSVCTIDSTTLLGTNQVETSSSTSTSNAGSTIDSDEFLTLLLVQIQNQDPMDPMDTNEMTAELCSLSQLEAAQATNAYLENLTLYNSSVNNSQALECIGKTVGFSGDEVSVTDGDADDLRFELSDDASQVEIAIYDEEGEEVRNITLSGEFEAGSNSLDWNGKDDDGDTLLDGTYTFEISAYDSNGDSVEATTFFTSQVNGVVYRDGIPYLTTSDGEIAYGEVSAVYQS